MPRLEMAKSSAWEWRAALLREFEVSGLSLAEFCRRAGLAYSTMLAWRRKAREAAALSPPVFVEVEALPSGPASEPQDGRGTTVPDERRGSSRAQSTGMERVEEMEQPPAIASSTSRREPLWEVELALPGGLTLRIHALCPDRGGGRSGDPDGGGLHPGAVRKGGAP